MAGSVRMVMTDPSLRGAFVMLYVSAQMSIPQIARVVGRPRSAVRSSLIKNGVTLRTRADGIRLRGDVLGQHARGKKHPPRSAEWRANISKGKLAWGEANALGVALKPSGYLEYTRGEHKGRLVHVVMTEAEIGRRIGPDEVVHHVDHNKTNNAPENRELMTRSEHTRRHRLEDIEAGILRRRDKNGRFA